MNNIKLISYSENGEIKAGVLKENMVHDLGVELCKMDDWQRNETISLDTVFRNWSKFVPMLNKITQAPTTSGLPIKDVILHAPLNNPGTIYCAGANYYDHAQEMGVSIDKGSIEPLFFLKSCGSIIGPNQNIRLPSNYSEKYDWEVELAAVIGKKGHHLNTENATDIIAGYTIFNDVSARDVGRRNDWNFGMDWFRHKSFDTSAPMGPWIVPSNQINNPQNLNLKTKINDKVMQDGNTNGMIFSIAELIVSLSRQVCLKPGDVIATGTCAGVGIFRGIFLQPGDLIELEIEDIGILSNPVIQGN